MARIVAGLLLLIVSLAAGGSAHARPPEGFHEGPFLQLAFGARDASFDTNIIDGQTTGKNTALVLGLDFGWNITDPIAVELRGLYSTAKTPDTKQHLINVYIGGRYNFIVDALTNFDSLRILPFLALGGTVQLDLLPSVVNSDTSRVIQWGGGLSTGGGVSFLFFNDTVYLTLRSMADVIHRYSVSETVGTTSTVSYAGGWGIDWHVTTDLGVHF